MSNDSCLATNLSHYAPLSEDERGVLARFEESEKHVSRGTELRVEDADTERMFAVTKGWLYSYVDFADGRRQIVKVHTPGDMVGFADLAYKTTATTLRAADDAVLCPFPKMYVFDVLRAHPRLSALLLTVAVRDQAVLIDTLRAMGRMTARERVAYFLLDLLCRLRVVKGPDITSYHLPLSQAEIGDIIGLTNVYVSKTLGRLENEGKIRRDNGTIEILQEAEMRRLADFTDRYATLDTSWFDHMKPNH